VKNDSNNTLLSADIDEDELSDEKNNSNEMPETVQRPLDDDDDGYDGDDDDVNVDDSDSDNDDGNEDIGQISAEGDLSSAKDADQIEGVHDEVDGGEESQLPADGNNDEETVNTINDTTPSSENKINVSDSIEAPFQNVEESNAISEGSEINSVPTKTENTSNNFDAEHSDQTNDSDKMSTEGENNAPSDGSNNANVGAFTLERLHATRRAATELISKLEQYYAKYGIERAKEMMLNGWLEPWDFDGSDADSATKRGRINKLVDTMARALVTDDQEEFIIGTIGSSVAAGHDNCHYDSYESQMQRTFAPVWEAAGMKLTCQNAGEGGGCGDDYKNQIFCIKQNVSPEVDIAHYSWTYFEAGGPAWVERESLIRWSQMLPKQPLVHVFNTGELPGNRNSDEYKLTEYYAKYGYNALYMQSGMQFGGHDYAAEKRNGVDRFSWGHVGDGYHDVVRYGEKEENELRKESLGVVMRNWHPGPLAFQFTADAFTYVYTKAILKALDLIEDDLNNGRDPREMWSASKRAIMLKRSLPEPKYCDPEYCVVDEAPGCINYEKPIFGQWGPRVEDPNDDLNPHKGELQNWEVWREENDMWHMVTREDQAVFQNRDDKEICKHLDACGGISATSNENGMVVFRLPKMEVGLVVACGCCGKEVAQEMFLDNDNIEVRYNGAILNKSTWDLYPNKKCVRLLKRFPTEGDAAKTPTGHAYLSIKALDGLSKPVRISHLITL